MRKWMIVAICAAGGAVVGAAIGDLLGVSHIWGVVLAGLGGGIGGGAGVYFTGQAG